MPIERPTKIICEICGSTHPTTAHADSAKNATEADHEHETEPNREAMEKVVDIFTAEDLKYRAYDPFITTLETGIPTPATSFLKEPFGTLDEGVREKMKKEMKNLEQERMRRRVENAPFFDFEEGARFRKANVYYPEGLLKAFRDHVTGTETTEIWSKDYLDHADVEDVGWAFTTKVLYEILKKLPAQEQEKIAELLGRPVEQFDVLNHPALHARRPTWDPQTLDRWEQMEKDEKLMDLLRDLLNNANAFEIIRKAWLKKFLIDTNSPTEEYNEEERLVDESYVPNYGFILSPSTKVAVAPHPEFPSQATILSPRVSPKKFIGIFVNSDYSDRRDYVTDEAINLDIEGDVEGLTMQEQLEHAVFEKPAYPVAYLLIHYARPFFIFLERQGFNKTKLEKINETFSAILAEAKKGNPRHKRFVPPELRGQWQYLDEKNDYWGDTSNFVTNVELDKNLDDRAFAINRALHYMFGQEYPRLEEMAKKFIKEKSPIKDGENLWTGLIRLAERHQLPVYNLRGELLWPKHMTHEQLAEFVAEKPEEKK